MSIVSLDSATLHLQRVDKRLSEIIEKVGPCTFSAGSNHFATLAASILSQQLSSVAARTICKRVELLMPDGVLSPDGVAATSDRSLRAAGVSRQKVDFLRSLVEAVSNGVINFTVLNSQPNAQVITQLTAVRGIGRWTAEMFLIFALGRLDVFPVGDAGVRSAMRRIYNLEDDCEMIDYEKHANRWNPYASVASWYCWRALDLKLL
jgi:DNA-3-methyladenine glycosylase II